MLGKTLMYWRSSVRQPAVWSVVIWMGLLIALTAVALAAVGGRSFLSVIASGSASATTLGPTLAPGAASHVAILLLLAGAISTFVAAGEYGMFGRAVAGKPVTWQSFWGYMFEYYGRLWGFALYTLLWIISLVILAVVLGLVMHAVGVLLVFVAAFFSWPWAVRMMGGLFVSEQPWRQSFTAIFHSRGYGAILGAELIALTAYMAGFMVVHLLGLLYAPLAIALSWAVDLFLLVAGQIWMLAVYRASVN